MNAQSRRHRGWRLWWNKRRHGLNQGVPESRVTRVQSCRRISRSHGLQGEVALIGHYRAGHASGLRPKMSPWQTLTFLGFVSASFPPDWPTVVDITKVLVGTDLRAAATAARLSGDVPDGPKRPREDFLYTAARCYDIARTQIAAHDRLHSAAFILQTR